MPRGGIVAGGPHGADAIGVGYLFDTDMVDGAYVALSNKLAPQGYAYLFCPRFFKANLGLTATLSNICAVENRNLSHSAHVQVSCFILVRN